MMETFDFTISRLKELLDTVSALPSVPELDPSNASASYEEWQKQFQKLNDLKHDAEIIALCTIPAEIQELLHTVKAKVQERQRL